jgi:hypothetical protein
LEEAERRLDEPNVVTMAAGSARAWRPTHMPAACSSTKRLRSHSVLAEAAIAGEPLVVFGGFHND